MKHEILHELKEHIPFTSFATIVAIILIFTGYFVSKTSFLAYSSDYFYIFHDAHLFFSAIVSAAMFYKYKNKFMQALLVGIFSSVVICTVSDIIFPYLGGIIMGFKMEFHLDILEEPLIVFVAIILGSLVGIWRKITKVPHFFHVLLSTFASLLYLVAFGVSITLLFAIGMFVIVVFSVVIPCCLSDIVLPMLFVKNARNNK